MQERSLKTRADILVAASECFARNGYDATGVAEICAAAGVSKGAFYHHFKTKQALFLALLENWLLGIDTYLEDRRLEAASIPEALRQISGLMSLVFAQAGGRLPMFLEFWTQAGHDPVIWQAVIQPYQRYQVYFSNLVRSGIAEGSLKPVEPETTARALVSLALGALLQGLLYPEDTDWGNAAQESIELFLTGIEK